ncbi:radical SAM protein [Patescibacteria group bacterium]|nr:radical SAM protein [Patescibacteria group bacterium]
MCNIWQRKNTKEMGLEEWKTVVDDPIFRKVKYLTLSGGEPMLHPEFLEIAELFLQKGIPQKGLSVISNGFMTERVVNLTKEVAVLCKKHGVDFNISVSLDGKGRMHEQIRRIPRAFEKTSQTILELKKIQKKYGFGLGSGSLIIRPNVNKMAELEDWYKKRGIDYSFQIVGFHDTFVDNLDTKEKVNYGNNERQALLSILKKYSKPSSITDFRSYYWRDMYEMYARGSQRTTPCPFLVDQMVIDCMGDVYYCLSAPAVGNFLQEKRSIAAIYKDPLNLQKRKGMASKECLNCNSGCNVNAAIASDMKRYLWFRLTGKLWGH